MSLQQLASKDLSRFLSDAHFVQLHDVIIIYIAQEVLALLPDSTVREKERILVALDNSFFRIQLTRDTDKDTHYSRIHLLLLYINLDTFHLLRPYVISLASDDRPGAIKDRAEETGEARMI